MRKGNILLYGIIATIGLFIFQSFANKAGTAFANLFSYEKIDFYNVYAKNSVHHITMMLIALIIIFILSKLLKIDFGFRLGDSKKGMKYLIIFTAVFAVISLASHILMYIGNQLPVYEFPLNKNNIIGTLGFQLFLTGTAEEILFRALPITVLIYVFRKSIAVKWNITLEVIIASVLFSIAHIKWSLSPFTIDANYSQLLYAFAMGIIQGIAYQDSRSILYPMLMHSISNVLMVGTGYLFAIIM